MRRKKAICFLITLILFACCSNYVINGSNLHVNAASTGWVNINNNWYYYENGAKVKDAWKLDSHGWCYLSSIDGSWVQQGWAKDSNGWCYIEYGYWADYAMWAKDSNGWCYITDNGYWDGKTAAAVIPTPLRFVVMADCKGLTEGTMNTPVIEKTLTQIKKLSPQPSFALMIGDLVYCKGTYSETKAELTDFKNLITKYYPISFYYPGFGNHEAAAGAGGEQAFGEVFKEFNAKILPGYNRTVYYFDRNNIRFYMLNTNNANEENMVSDTQLSWIKSNTDNSIFHDFYFFHEPAYPTGAHVESALDENKFQRDKLWQIIDKSNLPMVFCGHEHNYTRRHIDSDFNETVNGTNFNFSKVVYQVTTGTFGAEFYTEYTDTRDVDVPPVAKYHFAVVDAYESSIKVTVYDIDGNIIDQFSQ